jgi:hypothetical protein
MLTQDRVGASHPRGEEKTRSITRLWLLAVLFMLISPSVFALTGNELLKQCSAATASTGRKQCESYVDGVVSGINTLTTSMRILHPGSGSYPQLFCVPRFTATNDLVAATVSYLKQHTENQHYDASSEVLLALQQAYPCKGG